MPEDFDEAVKETAALGVKVISGPNYRDDGYCTYFFLDPDGNIVHFAKWKDDRRNVQEVIFYEAKTAAIPEGYSRFYFPFSPRASSHLFFTMLLGSS